MNHDELKLFLEDIINPGDFKDKILDALEAASTFAEGIGYNPQSKNFSEEIRGYMDIELHRRNLQYKPPVATNPMYH